MPRRSRAEARAGAHALPRKYTKAFTERAREPQNVGIDTGLFCPIRLHTLSSIIWRGVIQEDIETTKKQRGKALRQREKARQFDRQREEIHPSYVGEVLESLAPAARESLQLAEAIPDPEKVFSWEPLAIRYREKEGE